MKTLIVERDERGVVSVELNRPEKKNAISYTMFEELLEVFSEVSRSDADRVLVLSGAGGNFSAGADLGSGDAPDRHQLAHMRFYGSVALALHQLPQPAIAKIRGVAVGAGLNLALGCDLIAAAPSARFSEIFARRGLSLDVGGSWLLPRLIGLHRAKELALLAEIISADEAERIGIVNRVVPDGELDALVDAWAGRLAAGPPLALAMSKRLLNQSVARGFAEALDAEGMAQSVNTATEDTKEALRAFFRKTEPKFRGR
ncbi:MAG TPA: enoyl-CoA hydratase-related protein [Myxococcota bacterium]|nr:enoyl-CoA hydratase-related protein [Myxococcota bacterium]